MSAGGSSSSSPALTPALLSVVTERVSQDLGEHSYNVRTIAALAVTCKATREVAAPRLAELKQLWLGWSPSSEPVCLCLSACQGVTPAVIPGLSSLVCHPWSVTPAVIPGLSSLSHPLSPSHPLTHSPSVTHSQSPLVSHPPCCHPWSVIPQSPTHPSSIIHSPIIH
jgi:hypothetical protein